MAIDWLEYLASRTPGRLLPLLGTALLASCSTYHALPLNDRPTQPASVRDIRVDTGQLAFPVLKAHRFDPSDGLDMDEVAILAVINNPDLKLARDDAGVSRAQSFAAHLLPDPQFNLTRDYPKGGPPGTTSAYNAGLAYDINTLVTHGTGVTAAKAEEHKTDLNLLWQEWQVVAQARVLFSQIVSQEHELIWLARNRDLLAKRYRQSEQALADGDITADSANASLAAWQDAARQVNDLQRQDLKARQDLNALLGLAPEVKLTLVDSERLAAPGTAAVSVALHDLPARRPDLLALKAGYAAEDARYRQAILAQFPPLNVGLTQARDTAGLLTRGFTLNMVLPLLNGNRGNIRIEEATRKRLHDEYEQRLVTARNEVERLVSDNQLIAAQLDTAQLAQAALDKAADYAFQALAAGGLDWPGYAAFESARIAKHVEVANLRQSLLEGQIALLTLLGGEFPISYPDSEPRP